MIKKSILYLASHFFICTFIFLCIQKPLFMFYNWGHGASACSFADWARIYSHGISLDFATAGYFYGRSCFNNVDIQYFTYPPQSPFGISRL